MKVIKFKNNFELILVIYTLYRIEIVSSNCFQVKNFLNSDRKLILVDTYFIDNYYLFFDFSSRILRKIIPKKNKNKNGKWLYI